MIALTATCRNEGDIIECWLRHHLAEGVDLILIADASDYDEGTRDVLSAMAGDQITWTPDNSRTHRQQYLQNMLAEAAACRGADWVIASDIDEFWYSHYGTVAEALSRSGARKTLATRYLHYGWDERLVEPEVPHLRKVAFRPTADTRIFWGNHDVTAAGDEAVGLLEIRELHYRSFEHFRTKIRDGSERIDPELRAEDGGIHLTRHEHQTDEELRQVWEAWLQIPRTHDPIPTRTECRPRSRS